ncbi:uncharacterized protein C15orf39 homolog isoform X2 [Pyxicephalus adspersus]|uniref:uncharacterized protein C15orf39 homolog isoform X2 n=2 Tax=Pyxicephalus adspersus TaxID=30357 RepID=UPI003B592D8A
MKSVQTQDLSLFTLVAGHTGPTVMSGRRHSETMDHTMYSKISRVEGAPHHSIPCTGKTVSKDLQASKNFLTYPLSSTEGQHSFNPWCSTTAYLQYASNALNHHLQSSRVSKCQGPEMERTNNSSQLPDNSSSNYSAHRYPVYNYHMSSSYPYPQIAVPRPVYRSPSSFVDPGYQSRDFQSMYPSAVEQNPSIRFPYSSSPLYLSGMKNLPQAHNGYYEIPSPSSLARSVQELGPVQRHRTDMNTTVGSSSSCYQEDVFTERLHSFSQHNMQLLCAEGSVSVGKTRNSAFSPTQSPQRYKCIPYQGSPDTRMGQMYSKTYYDSAMDSYHQRSALHSGSVDKSVSPHSIKRPTSYRKAQNLHSGYITPEPRMTTQFDESTQVGQAQAEQELQTARTSRASREAQMFTGQQDKSSVFESGPVNRASCVNSEKFEKERLLGSAHVGSDLHERALYEKCVLDQSSHVSFLQQLQNSSSKLLPATPAKNMVTNEPGKEGTVTAKLSSSHSSLKTFDDRIHSNAIFANQTAQNQNQTVDTVHANFTMGNSSVSSRSNYYHQMSKINQIYSHETVQSLGCATPQASQEDADGSKSPPMPVINDVFSLAPYRAYLEGKAPHPFPVHKESEVGNTVSSCSSSKQLSSTKMPVEVEKGAKGNEKEAIPTIVNTECHNSEDSRRKTGESKNNMDSEVLDLSVKRSSEASSSTLDNVNVSHKSHKPSKCSNLVIKRNLPQVSEDLSIKSQEVCMSQFRRILPRNENALYMAHNTVITSSPSINHYLSQATERTPQLAQEDSTTVKSYICQSQESCPSQSPGIQAPEHQSSYLCQATQSLTTEDRTKHSSHTKKNLCSPPLMNFSNQAIKNQSVESEKCKSQLTKSLSQQLEGNTSQALKNFTPQTRNNCQSPTAQDKPGQLVKNYQSHAGKLLAFKAAETQPHNPQEFNTSHTPETPQFQQNCSSQTTETRYNYYNSKETSFCSTQSENLPVFVNTINPPTTFLPQAIFYSSPAAIFCPKNLNLPSHQHQNKSTEPTERRTRKSVDSCRSETSLSGSETEGSGFNSSKAFMIRKYKMRKFSTSGSEIQEANNNSTSHALSRPLLRPSDTAQSLPPSAPESSPTLGEANVSLASADEIAPIGSEKQFSELHRMVRTAVTNSVARSPSNLLEDWLEKTKDEERNKTQAKAKSGSRPNDPLPETPSCDIWQDFDGVRLCLYKLLSQLETFMFTRRCPFPHVIRAGAIFIPIYLVKEVLFPELGTTVDRVLQKHKVELRPTTLSEEKLLRETQLKDCPSRMLKLLALKQLPDVYPDLLHLFCEHIIQNHLGSRTQSGLHTHKKNAHLFRQ